MQWPRQSHKKSAQVAAERGFVRQAIFFVTCSQNKNNMHDHHGISQAFMYVIWSAGKKFSHSAVRQQRSRVFLCIPLNDCARDFILIIWESISTSWDFFSKRVFERRHRVIFLQLRHIVGLV
jgi:hypothetical protein